jgi:hypothetical protein
LLSAHTLRTQPKRTGVDTVIEKEQLAATAALTSLRLWAHRAPKAPEPREESKQNRGPEEELRGRRKKSFQEKSRKKTLSQENGIPNRPPLRITILALTLRGGQMKGHQRSEGNKISFHIRLDGCFIWLS